MNTTVPDTNQHARIQTLLTAMESGLYERSEEVRLAFLAAVAGESVFFLGPPGVAKSLIARRIKHAFQDARSFEYLMGRFSTPEEIFGPISLRRLKEADSYERLTAGYLPEADVVFLDEIWKAGPPIQNALLTALNERLFRNGRTEIAMPLKLVVAASNVVPESHTEQAAFWDRFLVRIVVEPIVHEASFRGLLTDDGDPYADPVPAELKLSDEEYEAARNGIFHVDIPESVSDLLWRVAGSLRENPEAPTVSDRRWKKIARLLRGSAFLHGRKEVSVIDCGIITHALWDEPEQRTIVDTIVEDALRTHDHGFASSLAPIRQKLDQTEEGKTKTAERIEEIDVPRVYRGEYYRLGDHPFPGSVLIWRGDYDRIDGGDPERCDLFYYEQDDRYSHTESVEMKRSGTVLETANGRYSIETERRTERVVEDIPPSAHEQTEHRRQAESLLEEMGSLLRSMAVYREQLTAEAERHLFVSEQRTTAVLAGIDRTIDAAGELELDIRRYLAE